MRVLVLGGAGYIGSVLCPMLVDAGHDVTVLDNFLYRQQGANSLAALCRFPNFDVYRVDVRDPGALNPYLKHADAVIPLAALVGAPLCDLNPIDARLVNVRHPTDLFLQLSSSQLCIMPTTESAYGANGFDVCTEDTPTNPLSAYAKQKEYVERALLNRDRSISRRLATVYVMSPRMRLELPVNDFAWKAYKEASILLFEHKFRRTVVHVHDVARAFLHALDGALEPGVYNVGSTTLSKLELCEILKAKLGGRFYYAIANAGTDPDQRNYQVSSAKLLSTGFRFNVELDAGLNELFKGFRCLTNTVHSNV